MARLSNIGALVTPERTSEESEGRSIDEAGAMAISNVSETRQRDDPNSIPTSNASDIDAMGQNESREVLQQRNAAIRHAGKQAVIPKPGKLPRRSGPGLQVGAGQRKLGTSVLANANTYDVPSDDETAPISRRPANTAPFSPLMRQMRHQDQMHQPSPMERFMMDQARCDDQLGQYDSGPVEDIENIRRASHAISSDNDAIEQGVEAEDSEVSRELPIGEVLGVNNKSTPRNVDAAEADTLIGASNDSADEHSHWNEVSKRKRGRPSKQPQLEGQGPRKRGRPSKSAAGQVTMREDQPVAQGSAPRQTHEETQVRRKRGRPSKSAVVHTEASIFDVPEDDNIRVTAELGRPSRSAAEQVESTGQDEPSPVTTAGRLRSAKSTQARTAGSSSRKLQPEAEPQTRRKSTRGRPSPQAINENTDQREENTVESPVILDPAQLGNINNAENNDQAQDAGEQAEENDSDEDEELADDDEDDDENSVDHADETEVQAETTDTDRHRLYGYWPTIREIMREVSRHRGNIVRIRDDEFKETLQACRDAIRDTSAIISANELNNIIAQCRSAIARAGAICRNPDALENSRAIKKRGWHIYKHLLPTLAKLLRAAIKAFERTDVEDFETDQISLPHLAIILELSNSASTMGLDAYHGFKDLSKTIKRDVHEKITIPIRGLHTALSARYPALVKAQETQRRNAELAQAFAAMEERREQQARRRQLELANQEKWKRMNQVRLNLCFNSSNLKKINHMRSCGMQLVETNAEGEPYLPTRLRDRRGDWSMREIVALEASLKKHVDTPDPLRSMVFEHLIAEQCPYRKDLTERNLLEIVVTANELKNFYIQRSRERGVAVDEWVTMVPRWMAPPRNVHDDGTSAEDVIEIV